MTEQEFEVVDAELQKAADAVLIQRRGAYAKDGDKLANFKMVAAETGLTPAKVCEVYMRKANIAIGKLMNGQEVPGETKLERFCDAFNYVRLAFAIMKEGEPKLLNPIAQPPSTKVLQDEYERMQATRERMIP